DHLWIQQEHVGLRWRAVLDELGEHSDREMGLLVRELIDSAAQLPLLDQVERALQGIEANDHELARVETTRLNSLDRASDHVIVGGEQTLEPRVVRGRADARQDVLSHAQPIIGIEVRRLLRDHHQAGGLTDYLVEPSAAVARWRRAWRPGQLD